MPHAETHPLLAEADTPSLATLNARALHKLGTDVSVIIELIELVRGLTGIKPPEKWAEHYSQDDWYRAILHGNYAGARAFILQHHA